MRADVQHKLPHVSAQAFISTASATQCVLGSFSSPLGGNEMVSWLFRGCFSNIDPGLFVAWDPSNQLLADLSLKVLLNFLEVVAHELEV
jgi:hypothetical protein